MPKLTTHNELEMLATTSRREEFGPGSAQPFLAIDLEDTDHKSAEWLGDLPCPVIGVGKGALMSACDVVLDTPKDLSAISKNIEKAPIASMILAQHLRASKNLSMKDTLVAESLAYATVQSGPEFANWRSNNKPEPQKKVAAPSPLSVTSIDNQLELIMNDPGTNNAIGVVMRDALCEALDLAIADSSITKVKLTGCGRVFSTGAAVNEFGEVSDPANAHWIRTLRLPAWRLATLSDRLHIHVNGVAYCAGTEIVGFAKRVTASPNAWFQLPELKYGLMPGAGGTAALPRRIGRQKTAYLAFSMKKIKAQTALEWGLVDEIVE